MNLLKRQILKRQIRWFMLSLAVFIIFRCQKDSTTPDPTNNPPEITSLTASPSNLDWGQTSQIVVAAQDPEGDNLSYQWNFTGGTFTTNATKDTATWQAPDSSGNFTCTVTVSDGKESANKSATLIVSEHPLLGLMNKDSLVFGASTNNSSFTITNNGTGTLTWSVTFTTDDGGAWIKSITPSQGAVATNQNVEIEVEVDRFGLTGGTYYGWVKVSSNDGSDSLRVVMFTAMLSVDKTSIDFGTSNTTDEFNISNNGTDTLTWSISVTTDDGGNWLSANPLQGIATTESDPVTVSVNRQGLSQGEYYGWVKIASNGGEDSVRVQMNVVNPQLNVVPLSLDFGTANTTLTFNITNSGSGTLTWNITESESWLSVSPASGSTTTETDTITVIVDRTGLNQGNYSAQIAVTSNGGNATVNVTMEVEGQPVLQVVPLSLSFGETSTMKTLTIRNNGQGTLNWSASGNQSWIINITPNSGSLGAGQVIQSMVEVSRVGLSPGNYSGTIQINSNGGNISIPVSMVVATPPEQWLFYDDGTFEQSITGGGPVWMLVRFTMPSGWNSLRVTRVRTYVTGASNFSFHIDGFDGYQSGAPICPQGSSIRLKSNASQSIGWHEHVVNQVFNSLHFFVGAWFTSPSGPNFGVDIVPVSTQRSIAYNGSVCIGFIDAEWGVRVYVERVSSPVSPLASGNNEPAEGMWLTPTVIKVGNGKDRLVDILNAKE